MKEYMYIWNGEWWEMEEYMYIMEWRMAGDGRIYVHMEWRMVGDGRIYVHMDWRMVGDGRIYVAVRRDITMLCTYTHCTLFTLSNTRFTLYSKNNNKVLWMEKADINMSKRRQQTRVG